MTLSTIIDLPTELMLEVGQYLILIDPYHCLLSFLSQTCRRFHDIFAPFIVTYHIRSVSESSIPEFIIASGQSDTFNTLSLDGNFKEMSLKLQDHTLNDIRCFRNLIFRANTISRIAVDVGRREITRHIIACLLNSCVQRPDLHLKIEENRSSVWTSRDLERGPFIFNINKASSAEFTPQEMQPVKRTWKDTLLGVLNALSFRLIYNPKENVSPLIPSTCNGLEVIPRKPCFEVPRPKSGPRLTGLWIEGDYLFSASNFPWTRDIINAAPMTHLSITKSTLSLFEWSQILPSIIIPTLSYLAIGRVSVAFPDMLDFFHRHPSLQEINLSDNEPIGVVSFLITTPSSKPNPLPKLKTLVGTPDYIYPFICHQTDGYFHDLNAYGIGHFPGKYECHFRENLFRSIFEHLATKRPRTHLSITLSGTYLNTFIKWFLNTSTSIDCRKLPRIWKVVLVGEPISRAELVDESVRALLVEQAKTMKHFAFMNEIPPPDKWFLVDRLFHVICPDLQFIEYKETGGYDDWSMII